ncbi:MAG: alpha/beta hydrolase [Candidatus Riflebacteria bacterium]|nr:alpha/beta hydrolase [Candidatus Riflebacteria bacterium]
MMLFKCKYNKILFFSFLFISFFNVAFSQTIEKVEIQGYAGMLKAIIQKPEIKNNEKIPFVIICHGFGATKGMKLLATLADKLQSAGIGSVRFDFIGHGESYGKFSDMTVPKQIIEAKNVYEYVSKLPYVSKIGMAGHSQGGVVAAMVSAELGQDKIPATALYAPAGVLRDDVLRGDLLNVASFTPENPPETLNVANTFIVGKEYLTTLKDLPIYETSRNYDGQTLVLHGKADVVVPYTYGKRFYDDIRHSHIRLFDGYDHCFTGHENEMADFATEFFLKELQ